MNELSHWFLQSTPHALENQSEISGLTNFGMALFLSHYRKNTQAPLFIVLERSSDARDLIDNLNFLLNSEGTTFYFPPLTIDYYRNLLTNSDVLSERNVFLHQLKTEPNEKIFVTCAEALCQKQIPVSEFLARNFTLEVNQEIERPHLIRSLRRAGYQPQPNCLDAGVFAVRGGVIDIFSPAYDSPFRLIFYGDFIEEIRFFDPSTQRSTDKKEKVSVVSVAATAFPTEENLSGALENLKKRLDDLGVSKGDRDELALSLQSQEYSLEYPLVFPILSQGSSLLSDYFPSNLELFVYDERGILRKATEELLPNFQEQIRLYEKHPSPVAQSNDLLLSEEDLKNLLNISQKFYFEDVPTKTSSLKIFEKKWATEEQSVLDKNIKDIKAKMDEGYRIHLISHTQTHTDRTKYLLETHGLKAIYHPEEKVPANNFSPLEFQWVHLWIGNITESIDFPDLKILFLREEDLLGIRKRRSKTHKAFASGENVLSSFKDLKEGDYVVHRDHGIGKYLGLKSITVEGVLSEFIHLEYSNGDKLYVPIYRLNLLQKYASRETGKVVVDKLGGDRWEKAKSKAKKAIQELAVELLEIQAKRKMVSLAPMKENSESFQEFELKFPYDETPDQQKAIDDVLSDLTKEFPMDRLVCGDVGYGKTEVAIRAAYRTVLSGYQVAILVPTTVLAFQHYETFRRRLQGTGVAVEMVSRTRTAPQNKKTVEALAQGKVDVIIGTHRLLSADVKFKKLGLVVIDEEHRFGVTHKEKLKKLFEGIHILTLTATPIPRTLNMSMVGIKDISLITTPPPDRLAVRTFVCRRTDEVIKEAIQNELSRQGQVFFVHNRIESIYTIAEELQTHIPNLKFKVAHGQMDGETLEQIMLEFYEGHFDCLLTTTIIESGLDVSRANTMIIDDADHLGLAQMYQLRGRVGRSDKRAYCYLLTPPESKLSKDAKQRLQVIQRYSELGAGFSVASHDLELRGAGDLLGKNQSGHVTAVGIDLYFELLEETLRELKGNPKSEEDVEPEITISVPAYFPEEYLPDISERVQWYRRLSNVDDEDKVSDIEEEIRDRFGVPPTEVLNLFQMMRIKFYLKKLKVTRLNVGPKRTSLQFSEKAQLNLKKLISLIERHPLQYSITPDNKFLFQNEKKDLSLILNEIRRIEASIF